MRISLWTRFDGAPNPLNGFGYATDRMCASLTELGYEWGWNLKDADVELAFEQPINVEWKIKDAYKIMMTPWESTALPLGWAEVMNTADEVWTPSPLIAEWFKNWGGITKPIYVYEHGIDPIWTPKKRTVEEKFRFLHHGFEGLRKGGRETLKAFRKAFPSNNDVELVMKTIPSGWKIGWFNKVSIINDHLSVPDLVDLYHSCNAYVYPSWGEGFGMTPHQALATGMPTITVPDWAPFSKFLDSRLNISAELAPSPWQNLHPGLMFQPDIDDIVDKMRFVYSNYDSVHDFAQDTAPKLIENYGWTDLTKDMFVSLESRLKTQKI